MTRDADAAGTFPSGGGPTLTGRAFWKMTGSGNDFVFFDNRTGAHEVLVRPAIIAALCDRRRGIGADGIVLIDSHPTFAFGMRYYNRDGSLAEMCGNAALCSASLARELGMAGAADFTFETPSGPVTARFAGDTPEIDMVPVTELAIAVDTPCHDGERRIGYCRVGVPHLVVEVEDIATVDVVARGRELRHLAQLRDGANVNFVAREPSGGRWRMRTYERGVEDETLACGTGTVATVALLNAWGAIEGGIPLLTGSGCDLYARAGTRPALRGEGRIVCTGVLRDVLPATTP